VPLRERVAGFEHSPLAAWVSSVEPTRVIWANAPALELWSASDLDELCARDFSNQSEASSKQARTWVDAFRAGTLDFVEADWTVYPRGVPRRIRIFISGIMLDDGQQGLLQQAIRADAPIDPVILRGAEAIRHASLAVALLSTSGAVLSRNPALEHAVGLDTPLSRWFEEPGAAAEILAVAGHGAVHQAELSSRASGQLRYYTLEARKVQDPVSGEDSILVHLLDETARLGAELDAERKGRLVNELQRALAMVEEQKQRWRALVDSAPDVVMIINRQRRVEFTNRRGAEELVGQPIEALFDSESRAQVIEAIEHVFATEQTHAFEASSSGGSRQHSIRLGPIHSEGELERLTLISSDVTEHRAIEHQLRHSQKMLAIGTLAGGIAHDFNNLLMVISGSCELATLSAAAGRDVQPLLDEIAAATERASTLTRQLLAFSRKQVLQPKRLDLNLLVREMGKLFARVIAEGITLELALDERPCWIIADPGQIEQVVMNLVVNASDAMSDGGVLTIATRWSSAHGEELVLEIADTGVGIGRELQSRIFEPFFTTKAVGKGTGLGLAMVHGIIEQSGGRITVESELGHGTRFEICLPRAASSPW